MKILWVINGYPPILNAGSEMYAHNLNKHLLSKGHEVKILLPQSYSNYENKSMNYEGVELYIIRQSSDDDNLILWSDIIITHQGYSNLIISYVGNLKPIIWICHNTFFDQYKSINNNKNVSIIYNSYALQQLANQYFNNRSFVMQPPILLNKPFTSNKPTPIRNEYITLINLSKNKGGEILKQLAEDMPNRKFMGVLGGYEEQIEQHKNVKIVPHTNNIQEIYDQTRLILMPSAYESWGMVASEAIINGIPVIANRTFGLEENLGEAGIYCSLDNLDEWKYAITNCDDPYIYQAQSDKCLKRAEEQKINNNNEIQNCMFFFDIIYQQSLYENANNNIRTIP